MVIHETKIRIECELKKEDLMIQKKLTEALKKHFRQHKRSAAIPIQQILKL